jgi:hypothetical protein
LKKIKSLVLSLVIKLAGTATGLVVWLVFNLEIIQNRFILHTQTQLMFDLPSLWDEASGCYELKEEGFSNWSK